MSLDCQSILIDLYIMEGVYGFYFGWFLDHQVITTWSASSKRPGTDTCVFVLRHQGLVQVRSVFGLRHIFRTPRPSKRPGTDTCVFVLRHQGLVQVRSVFGLRHIFRTPRPAKGTSVLLVLLAEYSTSYLVLLPIWIIFWLVLRSLGFHNLIWFLHKARSSYLVYLEHATY